VTSQKNSNLLTQTLSLYAQDSWKATPRLTFIYGVEVGVEPCANRERNDDPWLRGKVFQIPHDRSRAFGHSTVEDDLWEFCPALGRGVFLMKSTTCPPGQLGHFYDLGLGAGCDACNRISDGATLTTATASVRRSQI